MMRNLISPGTKEERKRVLSVHIPGDSVSWGGRTSPGKRERSWWYSNPHIDFKGSRKCSLFPSTFQAIQHKSFSFQIYSCPSPSSFSSLVPSSPSQGQVNWERQGRRDWRETERLWEGKVKLVKEKLASFFLWVPNRSRWPFFFHLLPPLSFFSFLSFSFLCSFLIPRPHMRIKLKKEE